MRLIVCAVGHRMPDWIAAGFEEYARRMPREAAMQLIEVRPEKRSVNPGSALIAKAVAAEAGRMRAALPSRCRTVALDERGTSVTSAEFSKMLDGWLAEGQDVAFLIGGADGLDNALKQDAALLLSLSSMTLPHHLVRVMLAEQLYRAISMLRNHPYHRA
jgi:23S rRNA (pseudouridine1915-N3)-methyltransferase